MNLQSLVCSLIGVCVQKLAAEEMPQLTGTISNKLCFILLIVSNKYINIYFCPSTLSFFFVCHALHNFFIFKIFFLISILFFSLDRIMQLLLQVFQTRGAIAHEVRLFCLFSFLSSLSSFFFSHSFLHFFFIYSIYSSFLPSCPFLPILPLLPFIFYFYFSFTFFFV